MGVRNLWKILKPFGKQESPNNKKLAIDTSIWMYQLPTGKETKLIYSISKRIFKILYNNITPVFVFDGNTPECKRKTVEMRRKIGLIKKRRDYFKQGRCMECHSLLKDCGHKNKINLEKINELDNDIIKRINLHNFNWGEFSDEIEYFSEEKDSISDVINRSSKYINESSKYYSTQLNPIINFNIENFNKLSKDDKLQELLYLREKRGMPIEYDIRSTDDFSNCQIRNLLKRNKINVLMKSLNKNNNERIKSDWEMNIEYKNKVKKNNEINQDSIILNYDSKKELIENKTVNTDIDKFMTYPTINENNEINLKINNLCEKYKDIIFKNKTLIEDEIDCKSIGILRKEEIFKKIKSNLNNINQTDICEFNDEKKDIEILDKILDNLIIENTDKNNIQLEYINDYTKNNKHNKKIKNIIIELLCAFNIKYIESIFEADSQCAYLYKKGIVDGVISEDNDILVYKANIYRNFFSRNKDIELYEYNEIEKKLGFKDNDIIKLSYLLGSDYTPGVYGIGIKKSLEKIKEIYDEDIKELIEIYKFKHVKDIESLTNKDININNLKNILIKYALPIEQIDEICIFSEKYNKNLKINTK